jgi:hypothetical protein
MPHAHLAARRRRRAELHAADKAQMDVQHPIAVELAEQVLAVRRSPRSCVSGPAMLQTPRNGPAGC